MAREQNKIHIHVKESKIKQTNMPMFFWEGLTKEQLLKDVTYVEWQNFFP